MMRSYEQLQYLIVSDLSELHRLSQRGWWVWPMDRVTKEEHIGRCCYLAEEVLSAAELSSLKKSLGLDEKQWKTYKAKISG